MKTFFAKYELQIVFVAGLCLGTAPAASLEALQHLERINTSGRVTFVTNACQSRFEGT